MTHRTVWLGSLLLMAACVPAWAQPQVGVLVLAHGGSESWNRTVQETVAQAQLAQPTEIAFGMGMHGHEVDDLQQAVARLEARGITRIIAVPLLVSSTSEVMRQLEYLLGLREHGEWEAGIRPVTVHVPVTMTAALDDDPVVADVLLERAKALSRRPGEETVILIAHGPNADGDNAAWLAVLGRVAAQLKVRGGFRSVVPVTMRDDAPEPVRAAAIRRMRESIQEEAGRSRALVIPVLISSGGVEGKIPQRLEGLSYAYDGAALLPHPKLAQWIARRVQTAIETTEPSDQHAASGRSPVASMGRL